MIINGNNSRSNNIHFVRTSPAKQAKYSSFGETLSKTASQRDAFSSSSASETPWTVFNRAAFSSIPKTQAKLDYISNAIKNTDYSDMSKAEIYADIERRYGNAFEDFYMTSAITACADHVMIREQFYNEVQSYVGDISYSLVNEARGYTDMSYDEIEAVVKEKYIGKTGFTDQLNLFGELYSTGVLANKLGARDAYELAHRLSLSVECGGGHSIPRNEWLEKVKETGAKSPYELLLNAPTSDEDKEELLWQMVDEILFGIVDKVLDKHAEL